MKNFVTESICDRTKLLKHLGPLLYPNRLIPGVEIDTAIRAVFVQVCDPISDHTAAGSGVLYINNWAQQPIPSSCFSWKLRLWRSLGSSSVHLGGHWSWLYPASNMSRISSQERMVFNSVMGNCVLMNCRGDIFIGRPIDLGRSHRITTFIHAFLFFAASNSFASESIKYTESRGRKCI